MGKNFNTEIPNSKVLYLVNFVKVLNFDKVSTQAESLRGTKQPH